MAITVTATQGTDTFNGIALAVRVYTGAVESGGASNTFHVSPGTGPAAVSLTPNASNSLLVFSTTIDTNNTFTAATSNAYDNNSAAPFGVGVGDGHYTGTVTSGVGVTLGSSAPTISDHYNCAGYEIRPSGGSTPVLDGSGPAWANTSTAITATTASFTPPPGSVLVALIETFASGAGSGQTMTVSDTSGLAWTQRAGISFANQSEAVFIFTATVPAAAAAEAPWQYEPPPDLAEDGEDYGVPEWPPWIADAGAAGATASGDAALTATATLTADTTATLGGDAALTATATLTAAGTATELASAAVAASGTITAAGQLASAAGAAVTGTAALTAAATATGLAAATITAAAGITATAAVGSVASLTAQAAITATATATQAAAAAPSAAAAITAAGRLAPAAAAAGPAATATLTASGTTLAAAGAPVSAAAAITADLSVPPQVTFAIATAGGSALTPATAGGQAAAAGTAGGTTMTATPAGQAARQATTSGTATATATPGGQP